MLPAGVSYREEGALEFVTQRGYWTPPYESCMFASLCMILQDMGLSLPLNRAEVKPDNFVHALHVASGAPLTRGTSTAESVIALKNLFGEDVPPIVIGTLPDADLLEKLTGPWTVRVQANMGKMPRRLRRWCGYKFTGRHALALGKAHKINGTWQVFLLDPMGRPSKYSGEWVNWDDIKDALLRSDGNVQVTMGEHNSALPPPPPPPVIPDVPEKEDEVLLITNGVRDEYRPVKKGTPFLRPDTLAKVTSSAVDADYRCIGYSQDGKYAALQVRTLRIPGVKGISLLLAETALLGDPIIKS